MMLGETHLEMEAPSIERYRFGVGPVAGFCNDLDDLGSIEVGRRLLRREQ
jgi:hypothetical protein